MRDLPPARYWEFHPGRKKRRSSTGREENGPYEVSSKPAPRSLRLPDDAVELIRSPRPSSFVASSSLTSCSSDGDRKGRAQRGRGPSFPAPREVVAREVGACTSNSRPPRPRAVPLNRICQWGTIWWRERPGRKRTRGPRKQKGEAERKAEGEVPSHRTRVSAASSKLCRLFRTVGL